MPSKVKTGFEFQDSSFNGTNYPTLSQKREKGRAPVQERNGRAGTGGAVGSAQVEKEREIGPSGDRAIEPSKTGGSRKSIVAGQRPALRQKLRRPLGAPLDELIHGQDSVSRVDESVMSMEEF